MFDWLSDPQAWAALATLTALEIVLGIDNIIFISILTGRLPHDQQARGRTLGLALAMGMRILLLLSLTWVMGLTEVLFEIPFLSGLEGLGETARGHGPAPADGPAAITGRDIILLLGGLFLIGKSTHEIHAKLEGDAHHAAEKAKTVSFASVLIQIALLDLVFSLDSVITAVGMADEIVVMVIAVIIAVGVMMIFATPISNFVHRHPTVKMLALAFLILIGVTLVAEGLNQHISKGYIYSAMTFSLLVEMLNIRAKRNQRPVELREPYAAAEAGAGVPAPGTIHRPAP
ncbi:MAG TPA: TerC family protein [Rubricoccaceae bacterium]|nr:TerC family protein [Rubricoccaceae bacterium]